MHRQSRRNLDSILGTASPEKTMATFAKYRVPAKGRIETFVPDTTPFAHDPGERNLGRVS
jgi:hypothetical protein